MPAEDLKTIQSSSYKDVNNKPFMAKNEKSFKNFSYFLGGIDVTHQNLDQFNPYIQGVSRLFMHKPPLYMNVAFHDATTRFKTYIESGYTRIDGISDISVSFVDFEGGFAGQRFSNVSLAQDETDTITVSVYELSGSPVREYLDTWISGVRDPRSGIAHYHGLIGRAITDGGMEYAETNHTAEFIYVTLDPTGLKPEYCCMFAHAFPTKVPKSHLNYEKGERSNVQMDIEFKVTKYESPAINDIGIWYINNSKVTYNYLDFDPHVDIKGKGYNDYFTYSYDGTSGVNDGVSTDPNFGPSASTKVQKDILNS